jgi:ferric iron reductase protein FhuF
MSNSFPAVDHTPSMIGPLGRIFHGDLSRYGLTLGLRTDSGDALALNHFLSGAPLNEALRRFALRFPGAHPKALASIWIKLYFNALLVPLLAASALTDWAFPTELDDLALRLDTDGAPTVIELPHVGCHAPAIDAAPRLQQLVRSHLSGFIAAFASHTRLAQRLLWNNAAVIAEDTLAQCDQLFPHHPAISAHRALLIGSASWQDGLDNPMHAPTRLHQRAHGEIRLRKLCCLRYDIPGLDYCVDCPLNCRPRRGA